MSRGGEVEAKQILGFIKVEHTLFSLPFILIGALMAGQPTAAQFFWILVAAVGARGLAMALNRIIDRKLDAANPRTAGRHLATGSMSLATAWKLCAIFLLMLVVGAWMLNPLCLYLSPIPVLAFVVYPYLKRYTWLCHVWLGVCLALGAAGGWVAITGEISSLSWYPNLLLICLGVVVWIATFDINYARMDIESDKANGVHSFPVRFGEKWTVQISKLLTFIWAILFLLEMQGNSYAIAIAAAWMVNSFVLLFEVKLKDFQRTFFYTSVATGWIILAGVLV